MCTNRKTRLGFSLMELVVVITILAILGGIIVAIMPNLVKRTHLAKCSDTISSLNNAWMRAYVLNARYPDAYDSLLGAGGTALYSPLTPGLTIEASSASLTAKDVAALRSIGITRVVDLATVSAGGNVTNDCAPIGAASRVLTSGGNLAMLNLSAHEASGNQLNLKRHLVRNPDGSYADNRANTRYLIFGIGPNCTGVGTGKLIQEAPTHFAGADEINPSQVYQRYLVVFSLVTNPTTGEVIANFEAAAGNDVGGPSSADGHIRQFFEDQSKEG